MARRVSFQWRKRLSLGPFFVNLSKRGVSSYGVHVWRWTWNLARGTHSVDTLGPGSVRVGRRRRRPS